MKNIIYQYWKGDMKPGVEYSCKLMKEYADRIGAEYKFDFNTTIAGQVVNVPIYYEPANPLVDDSFDEYDNVMLCDVDVFPTEGLSDNIFDLLDGEDAGICTEPKQPYFRTIYNSGGINSKIDKEWAEVCKKHWGVEYPVDEKQRPEVFNTGVVVISKAGLAKMKSEWPTFQEYVDRMNGFPKFYKLFQDYFSAFIHLPGFNLKRLPNEWNCYMHKVGSHPNAKIGDNRPENAKLVHIMFRTADDWPTDVLWRITNKPIAEWNLPLHKEWPNDPPRESNSLLDQLANINA
jgi:lipopolysaccharide biosynthesis glycosyltransferase